MTLTVALGGLASAYDGSLIKAILWTLSGLAALGLVADVGLARRRRAKPPSVSSDEPSSPTPVSIQSVGPEPEPESDLPAESRTVVDVTPAYLLGLFDEHTSVQAQRLLEPFIGNWMRVSDPLGDVSSSGSFVQVTFQSEPRYKRGEYFTIYMYFPTALKDRLAILQRGTPIMVLGRIRDAGGAALHLEDCELEEP